MKDFETSAEPLQDWLNVTEQAVQESSTRLHDLAAKKQELQKLQVTFPSRSLIFGSGPSPHATLRAELTPHACQ